MKNYNLLYLPGIIMILIPIIAAICKVHQENAKKRKKIAAKESREAARREALRRFNEQRKAEKEAEKAAKAAMPKRKPGRPRKNPLPEQRPENISQATHDPVQPEPAKPAAPDPVQPEPSKPFTYCGNNAFAGQTVAFTGTLPGMTRSEAIKAVQDNGGKAFETMPAATTILVVGDRPGMRKMDKADDWHVRKITAAEFFVMIRQPLTVEPDDFAKLFFQKMQPKGA